MRWRKHKEASFNVKQKNTTITGRKRRQLHLSFASADCVELEELVPTLVRLNIPEIAIQPANNRIRYRHYVHTDGTEVFLFINEGTTVYHGKISLPEHREKTAYFYNAWDNRLEAIRLEKNQLWLEIEPLQSRIIILDGEASAGETAALVQPLFYAPGKKKTVAFSEPWLRSVCRSIDYPAFAQGKIVQFPDTLAAEKPEFSGFVRYSSSFQATQGDQIFLEITDAHEGVEVFLNKKSLGIQIVPTFRFDLSSGLRSGTNELTIEVATTLERENSNIPDVTGQVREPVSLSGITGTVYLWNVR